MELVLTNLLLIALGGCLGSFASLLIYRLPLEDIKINILKPRSFCPQCKTQLGIIQLIPFLGYLYNRGACFACNAKINHLYLINELIIAAFISTYKHHFNRVWVNVECIDWIFYSSAGLIPRINFWVWDIILHQRSL